MQEFSIKEVERLTGIKAHTLRIWEQRYHIALPHRKDSQHRFYTNEDLKHILRIAWLYNKGYRISMIAALTGEAVADIIEKELNNGSFYDDVIAQMLEASKCFDEPLFTRVFGNAVVQLGMEKAMLEIGYPFLEKIGLLWMGDSLIPAQEHFGSVLIRHFLIRAIDSLPAVHGSHPPIVLFAPEEEHHEIPLLFIHYLLRSHQHPVRYFGANAAAQAIEYFCEKKPFAHLHYHQVTNFTHLDVDEYLESWCLRFPAKRVILSGRLASAVLSPPANARLLCSMEELLCYCRKPFANV